MSSPPNNDRLLKGIMLAILVWGSLLALGVGLFGISAETGAVQFAPNLVRGLVVFACVAAFLLGWRALLRTRR